MRGRPEASGRSGGRERVESGRDDAPGGPRAARFGFPRRQGEFAASPTLRIAAERGGERT